MATLKLRGAKQMASLLRKLPKRITKKILKKVLRKAARPVILAAKSKVPKQFRVLQKSIGASFLKTRKPRKEVIKVGPRTGKKAVNNGWYGHLIEFGTKSHTVKADPLAFTVDGDLRFVNEVTIPSIPAQPFLGPAFEISKAKALEIMGKELGPLIEKEAIKLVKTGKL